MIIAALLALGALLVAGRKSGVTNPEPNPVAATLPSSAPKIPMVRPTPVKRPGEGFTPLGNTGEKLHQILALIVGQRAGKTYTPNQVWAAEYTMRDPFGMYKTSEYIKGNSKVLPTDEVWPGSAPPMTVAEYVTNAEKDKLARAVLASLPVPLLVV